MVLMMTLWGVWYYETKLIHNKGMSMEFSFDVVTKHVHYMT